MKKTAPPPVHQSLGSLAKDTEALVSAIHDVALGTRPDGMNVGDGYLLSGNGHFYRRSGPPPMTVKQLTSKRRSNKVEAYGEYWLRVDDREWLRSLVLRWMFANARHETSKAVESAKEQPLRRERRASYFMDMMAADPRPFAEIKEAIEKANLNQALKSALAEAAFREAMKGDGPHHPLRFEDIAREAGVTDAQMAKFREDADACRRKLRKTDFDAEPDSDAGSEVPETPPDTGDREIVPLAAATAIDRALRDFLIAGLPRAHSAAENENGEVLVKPHFIYTANPADGQAFAEGILALRGEGFSAEAHTLDALYPAARPGAAFPETGERSLEDWLARNLTPNLKIMRFFHSAFPDPQLMALAFEIAGSLIYGRPSERRVFVVKGKGKSGKTAFADLIRSAVGAAAPVMRREDIAHMTEAAALRGATCVVHSEYELPDPTDRLAKRADTTMLARIKELVGEREIRVEDKHRPAETIHTGDLQVLIHGNSHPQVGTTRENQAAWAARIVALPMETRLPDGERMTDLVEKIAADPKEMAIFSALALAHYANAARRGGEGKPEVFGETEASKIMRRDILANWVLDAAELFDPHGDPRGRLSAKEIKTHLIKHLKGCPHIVPHVKTVRNKETGAKENRETWDVLKPFYRELTHHLRDPAVYERPALPSPAGGLAGLRAVDPPDWSEPDQEEPAPRILKTDWAAIQQQRYLEQAGKSSGN